MAAMCEHVAPMDSAGNRRRKGRIPCRSAAKHGPAGRSWAPVMSLFALVVMGAALAGPAVTACSDGRATSAGSTTQSTAAPTVTSIVTSAGTATSAPVTSTSLPPTTTQPPPVSAMLPSALPADASAVDVPILMYHYVDEEPPPAGPYAADLTVKTENFEAQMVYLFTNDYSTISLADAYLAMAGLKELPPKPVVLTFDDGGADNYEVAFPILKEFGFTATFFIITGPAGRGKEGQMTWDQLREMAAAGMSVQSHTVSHPDLRGVSKARLETELVDSRQAIAAAIGEPSYVLCYPAGAYNARVIEAARAAGYVMAVATDKGSGFEPAGVFELKRRRVGPFTTLAGFERLLR
jgi:peptidoglycan/xylan/chitin deacetylase (PgdA/CDA1 family)